MTINVEKTLILEYNLYNIAIIIFWREIMKVVDKIVLILMIVLLGTVVFSKTTFAMDEWDTMKSKADAFITEGKNQGGENVISETDLQDFAMPIARTLLAIAAVVITVVTVVMGIQYVMANPADKAKLKQKLIGLLVSAIVIYGAQGIWAMLYNFMNTVTTK